MSSTKPKKPLASKKTQKRHHHRATREHVAYHDSQHLCCSLVMVLLVLAVGFLLFQFARSSARTDSARHCLDINRHRVRPLVPEILSEDGGAREPFAFGWLALDSQQNEVAWQFEDSIKIEPASLAIYGPLGGDEPDVAEPFVELGTGRDASHMNFAGVVPLDSRHIAQIKQNPQAYYVAFGERMSDGSVRELARDSLGKPCVAGKK